MKNSLHMKLWLSSTALLMILSNTSSASDLELKPISDISAAFKLAKVCFLPDCDNNLGGDINMDINNDTKWCEKKGYTYYSSGGCPQYYKKTDSCKKDSHYLKCDAASWCRDNGYTNSSCSLPAFIDTICPNGQPLYKYCSTDTARACKQVGYTNICSGSQKLHASNGRCSWNNSYGTCCSPSGCPTYTSLTGTYGSSGTQDGCGYTCSYTCNPNCPGGTSPSNPGGCGGSTTNGCGNVTCYYPYKACCDPNCPGGTSPSNPGGCGGSTTNGCGNVTCYYPYKACCDENCPSSYAYTSDPTGCSLRTTNGCGTKYCYQYKACCNSSSSNWCPIHSTCHGNCTNGKKYREITSGYYNGRTVIYTAKFTCVYSTGYTRDLGTTTIESGCWNCSTTHWNCKATCGNCYHPSYPETNYYVDYSEVCKYQSIGESC